MAEHDGWSLAHDYGDESRERAGLLGTVGFIDRSHLCKLELHGDVAELAGATLVPGTAMCDEHGAWWCPLTPERTLVLGAPGDAPRLRARVTEGSRSVAEVTCGLAALTLAGPLAGELLARFCAIDVRPAVAPVAAFRPGSIARTPGYLLRERDDELLIMVGWALGEYLWQVVADAAAKLGGGPAGIAALRAHRKALDA
ncbi:MAG TPA: hypothetical protein VHT27_04045 [Solirubrobacteraceae bacterium]|jgi:heterotetrameric sarcosine oxidase gamma subunit|nr:hypothetical protein [Solirubrobacteraceae bacterium]